ncbi:MAG: hypothetical protein K6A05_04530 [Lachnospiraceae bacterium]|nr:hypothetical protein [Lachnospiraceae bacterium]
MSKLDELLYESLAPSHEPSEHLNRQLMRRMDMKKSVTIRRGLATAATIACALLVGGTGVYAYNHFLQPAEIASEVSERNALAKAFESKSAIPVEETQQSGDYSITLLGIVSGKDLEPCVVGDVTGINKERSYAAIAVTRLDGQPMGDDGVTVSPLIHGVDWQDVTLADLDATLHWFVRDGVAYELMECDSLDIFALRGVQLGVVDQFGDEARAFEMDASGAYQKKAGYQGTNALFPLPLDESKGDEAAVSAYLDAVKVAKESDDEEMVSDTEGWDAEVVDFEKEIESRSEEDVAAYLKEHCKLVSTEEYKCTAEGDFSWSNETGSGSLSVAGYDVRVPTYVGMDSDGTVAGTHYTVVIVNDNQTVTMETYQIR